MNAYVGVQHVLLKDIIHEVNIMRLSNIVTVIILAISSTLTPQAMAEKLIPETDAELLIWSDATSAEYMKYAATEFNKDFGYKVKFTFRNIAPMDAASRIMQDGVRLV